MHGCRCLASGGSERPQDDGSQEKGLPVVEKGLPVVGSPRRAWGGSSCYTPKGSGKRDKSGTDLSLPLPHLSKL